MPRAPSRFASRLALVPRASLKRLFSGRREKPTHPRRILVVHQLLLGDTFMLTALLARLRRRYPLAEVVMTVSPRYFPLYATRPYGVRAVSLDLRDRQSVKKLLEEAPFDLALVPGDNRYAVPALALGSRWVVALAGDRPVWKNRFIDELVGIPAEPTALADMFALLAGEDDGAVYAQADWARPESEPFDLPRGDYAVLHVGAGSPLRLWPSDRWQRVGAWLEGNGLNVVLSAGPGEEGLIADIDPERRLRSYAGTLDLPQLWRLMERARLLVCLDTGVSHLAKISFTPAVVLYGPGSAQLFGPGHFWRNNPYRAVTIESYPCRDQRTLFKREIAWVRRCQRSLRECPAPRCMQAIDVAAVERAVSELLERI